MTDYCILDPTGNITALVKSPVDIPDQPEVAAEIMQKHPDVEQVGFVRFEDPVLRGIHAELRMAGGEFCGNASMCAAALSALQSPYQAGMRNESSDWLTVNLRVSGAEHPVEVSLLQKDGNTFSSGVKMPPPSVIEETAFSFHNLKGSLPLVRMEGISHIIIEEHSPFFRLTDQTKAAEEAVKRWCRFLAADGLGLMFLAKMTSSYMLTPLVYVPGGETVFWEHSCASGSAACAMYLADRNGQSIDLTLREPGGTLRASCNPETGTTRLFGSVSLIADYSSSIA